jgi:hypothetical protein
LDVLDGSDHAAELHGAPSGYMLGLTHYSGFPVHRSSRQGYSSLFHGQIMRVFRRPRSHDGRRNLGSILEPPPIVPDRQIAAIVLSHVSVPQPSIDLSLSASRSSAVAMRIDQIRCSPRRVRIWVGDRHSSSRE